MVTIADGADANSAFSGDRKPASHFCDGASSGAEHRLRNAAERSLPPLDATSPAQPIGSVAAVVVSGNELATAAARTSQMGEHRRIDGPGRIDKSELLLGEPRRYRNREHLRFVAAQACLVCGCKPSDPHHLRFTQGRRILFLTKERASRVQTPLTQKMEPPLR